jgi:hypothetical protein
MDHVGGGTGHLPIREALITVTNCSGDRERDCSKMVSQKEIKNRDELATNY